MEAEVLKSRTIRECILRCLSIADRAGVTVGFSFRQVVDGFAGSQFEYGEADIRSELNDLVGDQLAERFDDPVSPGGWRYRISSKGRDFVRGRFPWGRIDEFTGGQNVI